MLSFLPCYACVSPSESGYKVSILYYNLASNHCSANASQNNTKQHFLATPFLTYFTINSSTWNSEPNKVVVHPFQELWLEFDESWKGTTDAANPWLIPKKELPLMLTWSCGSRVYNSLHPCLCLDKNKPPAMLIMNIWKWRNQIAYVSKIAKRLLGC